MAGLGFNHEPILVSKIETKYRKINTKIPVPESISLLKKMYGLESRAMHGQYPIVWDRAIDFQVYDLWGNCWLDFTSTIFVANSGHSNPRIITALEELLKKPLLHTYTFASKERVEYLEYLIESCPSQFEKAFLLSAGTEATECAMKLMRLNGQKVGKRRGGILSLNGNWHGRTMGAQMLSSNEKQKAWIGFDDPNIHHIAFPYPWLPQVESDPEYFFENSINELLLEKGLDPNKDLCGIMLETFQGWCAVFYPEQFIKAVEKFAKKYNLLITFDEMQAGFGRTGKLFGYMHYGIEPDILCCGKGASSGLPLAIVLGSSDVMDLPDIGSMSSTHSANPLVCVAGKANLEALIKDGLIENAQFLGEISHHELLGLKKIYSGYVSSVQGKGLLAALIFTDSEGNPCVALCDRVAELCMLNGLLVVHTGRESIKLAPPLSISKDALIEGVGVLIDCIGIAIAEMQNKKESKSHE
jgi:4-aminobutyrate aminotransferase-like enzyme